MADKNIAPKGSGLARGLLEALETRMSEARGSRVPLEEALTTFVTDAFLLERIEAVVFPAQALRPQKWVQRFGANALANVLEGGTGGMQDATVLDTVAQAIFDLGNAPEATALHRAVATECFSTDARKQLPFAEKALAA